MTDHVPATKYERLRRALLATDAVEFVERDSKSNIPDYDFVNDDDNAMDDNGHGTHCAGIIAAGQDQWLRSGGLDRQRKKEGKSNGSRNTP